MRGRKPKPAGQATGHRTAAELALRADCPEPALLSGPQEPPLEFSTDDRAKECWEWFWNEVTWASKVDVHLIEQYCRTWSLWKRAAETMQTDLTNESKSLYKDCLDRLMKMQAMLGLSPADRQRIKAPKGTSEKADLRAFIEEAS